MGWQSQSQVHLALNVIRKTSPTPRAGAVKLGRPLIVEKCPMHCNVLIGGIFVVGLWPLHMLVVN